MSFKAVWGFDPEEVLRVQKLFLRAVECGNAAGEVPPEAEDAIENAMIEMPLSPDSQIHELRRMFRL